MVSRSLLVITQTELRLLTRQVGFKLYILLTGLLAIVVALNINPGHNSLDTLVWVVNNLAFFQFPLIALAVAHHVTKSNHRVGEWLWATPLEFPLFVLGQLLAFVIGFAIVTIIILIITCFLFAFQGTVAFSSLLSLCFYGLLLLIPITFAEIGVTLTLSLCVRHVLLAVLIVGGIVALLWLGVLMPTATLLTPLNYTLLTLRPDPIAIFGAEGHLLIPLLSFYMLLSLPFLILSLWIVAWLDQRVGWQPNRNLLFGVLFLISFLATSLAFRLYSVGVQRSIVPPPVYDQIDDWTVIAASFSGSVKDASLEIDGQLSLLNHSQQRHSSIILALNPGLETIQATINNQPATVEREGETIRLTSSDLRINPGEIVKIELIYIGTPYLLREDYALVRNVAFDGHNPVSFRRPIRAYIDAQTIFLARDGDWLVWPLVSSPHLATGTTELLLTVYSDSPVVTSGHVTNSDNEKTTYQWLNPPQLLILSSPYYEVYQEVNGTIWVAPLSHRLDAIRGSKALILRTEIAEWLEENDLGQAYKVVVLPYASEILIGNSIIGLPATGQTLTYQDGAHQSDEWRVRELALLLSKAWLKENMAWESSALNFDGQLRSSATVCTPPDENGRQECTTYSLGGVNPQAPEGRLVEAADDFPLLQALGTILAQQITLQVTGNSIFFENEQQLWTAVATDHHSSLGLSREDNALYTLSRYGLLPWRVTGEEGHDMAHLVLAVNCLHSELGNHGFRQLLQYLRAHHPVGGEPITENVFWETAGLFTVHLEAIRIGTHTTCQMEDNS